jgi:hypothetical protein
MAGQQSTGKPSPVDRELTKNYRDFGQAGLVKRRILTIMREALNGIGVQVMGVRMPEEAV